MRPLLKPFEDEEVWEANSQNNTLTMISPKYTAPDLTEISNASLNFFKDRDIRRRYADSQGHQSFLFDHVYGPTTTTQEIHNQICRPIVQSVLDGYNGAVFMYGQTTSGKTYSMLGTPELPGVLPCAVQDVFAAITRDTKSEYSVWVSYLEIYNEQINDLLAPGSTNLKIKEDPKHGIRIQGLKQQQVWTFDQVIILMNYGEEHRCYRETTVHEHSSRSHTIFKLFIESTKRTRTQGEGSLRFASLNLVDLAGSERLNEFEVKQPEQLGETGHINKSLFILANVVNKLAEGKSQYIPYRDSKLTRILSEALGGNSLAAIICTVSPAGMNFNQTLSTLRFAMRAKTVHNEPELNEILDDTAKMNQLKHEVLRLKEKLRQGHSALEDCEASNAELKRSLQLTRQELLAVQQDLQQTKVSRDRSQEMLQQLRQRTEPEGDVVTGPRSELPGNYQALLDRLQQERNIRAQLERELETLGRGGSPEEHRPEQFMDLVSDSIERTAQVDGDQWRANKQRLAAEYEQDLADLQSSYRDALETLASRYPRKPRATQAEAPQERTDSQPIELSSLEFDFSKILEECLEGGPEYADDIVSKLNDHHEDLLSSVNFYFDEARAQLESRHKPSSAEYKERLETLKQQYEEVLGELEASYLNALGSFEDYLSEESRPLPTGAGFLWGSGKDGRCGSGSEESMHKPQQIFAESGVKLTALVCGYHHSSAISDRGVLFTWGRGIFGQLGHDNNESCCVPTPVSSLSQHRVLQVACGWQHTLALTHTGRVLAWGYGDDGQLGHGDANDYLSPREVQAISHLAVSCIACGHSHSAALSEGTLYMWGGNPDGRLFNDAASSQLTPSPANLPGKVLQASLGVSHSAAVLEDGNLFTAGMGTDGQLGKPVEGSAVRLQVDEFGAKRRAVSVSCGDSFTLVLDEFQQVYSFGKGSNGRLGLGSSQDASKPTLVKGLSSERVVQISAGCRHSGAVTETGKLYMWGFNFYEQLALPGDRDTDQPTLVRSLQGVQSVSCGYFHTGAVVRS
jgi:centromeric protein E